MDGIYDLGGVAGFGPVRIEANEPTFHEPWEATAFRLLVGSVVALDAFNADEYRHAIERIEPVRYLQARYYERVLTGVTTLLVEKGFVQLSDLEARAGGRFPLAGPARPNLDDGRSASASARFSIGDRVRVKNDHQPGHTRVPKYVRGRTGVVTHVAPPFSYPDASAHGLPPRSEPTYHVEFAAAELWGEGGEEGVSVFVDLWESYLEAQS
jgi:nitrile hydratase beta subunit